MPVFALRLNAASLIMLILHKETWDSEVRSVDASFLVFWLTAAVVLALCLSFATVTGWVLSAGLLQMVARTGVCLVWVSLTVVGLIAGTSEVFRCLRNAFSFVRVDPVAGVAWQFAWYRSERELIEFCFHRMSGSCYRSDGTHTIIGQFLSVVTFSSISSWWTLISSCPLTVCVMGPASMADLSTKCTSWVLSFYVCGSWFWSQNN